MSGLKRIEYTIDDHPNGATHDRPNSATCKLGLMGLKRKRSNHAVHVMTPMEKADRGLGLYRW